MHLLSAFILLPLATYAARIVLSNDDGWAEMNIRTFHSALTDAGNYVVLSAPADDQSGRGSRDAPPKPRVDPCTFDACPANSPPVGFNASNPLLNYVNSYPVTSIKHGIDVVAPKFFGGEPPELAVSGPNLGSNLGPTVFFSGTVGAAVYAAHEAGIPSIAFSGRVGRQTPWYEETPAYSQIYAELATNLTSYILAAGPPYLPHGVWLNVNFPAVSDDDTDVTQFKFVLSRIFSGPNLIPDVETCGSRKLPNERDVVTTEGGLYISVSVGNASNKKDASVVAQAIVLNKLKDLLSCLPSESISSSIEHGTPQMEGQLVVQN